MTPTFDAVSAAGPLRSVAVIGAGRQGRAFALRCVQAGFSVVLEDVLSSNLRKAAETISAEPVALRERLHLAASVEEAVREADVAIDFVPDELESKLEIFSMMDRMAPPRTIFCTPTTLSISDLASCTYRPGQCVAMEPFGETPGAELAIVRGTLTTDDTLERVTGWLRALGIRVELHWDREEPALLQP